MAFSLLKLFPDSSQKRRPKRCRPTLESMEDRVVPSLARPQLPLAARAADIVAQRRSLATLRVPQAQYIFQQGTFRDVVQDNAPSRIVRGNQVFRSKVTIEFTPGPPGTDLAGGLNGLGFLDEQVTLFGPNFGENGLSFKGIVRFDGALVLPDGTSLGSPTPDSRDLIIFQANGTQAPGQSGVGQFRVIGGTGAFRQLKGFGRFFGIIRSGGNYQQAIALRPA